MYFDLSAAEVLLGVVSLAAAWYLGVRSERLSARQFATDWFRDLRAWASDAIDVLSEAAYCVPGRSNQGEMDAETRTRCRHRLSALIDRGRFFIPNYVPDEVGKEKPAAFRGLRHAALDYLVAAEQVLSGADEQFKRRFQSQRAALVAIKREFVSEIQEILDPRAQNRAVAKIILASRGDASDNRSAIERLIAHEHPDFSDL